MDKKQDYLAITFVKATTDAHFKQILALQSQNHFSAISEEKQEQEGFVFAAHSIDVLRLMAKQVPSYCAFWQ